MSGVGAPAADETDPVVVRRLADAAELAAALDLREAVFCGEQGVSLSAERDGRDGQAVHLGAFAAGRLLGTCRLLLEPRGVELLVQRVAVRADRRRQGIGHRLMDGALEQARALGAGVVVLHAQLESEGFYRHLGFARRGRPFLEEGIEHVAMRRELRLS
jgi:predicted GNAT family N-acyltransferase